VKRLNQKLKHYKNEVNELGKLKLLIAITINRVIIIKNLRLRNIIKKESKISIIIDNHTNPMFHKQIIRK